MSTSPRKTKQNETFCCPYIEKLSKNNALFDTIEINPRIVVFKYANKCVTYKETVTVTNKFDELRTFEIRWECSSSFVNIKVIGSTAVKPDDSFKMEVYLEPLCNNAIKDKRINIYLATEHPSLILEIPIIIVGLTYEVCNSSFIKMSKVPPNIKTNYAAVIYNPFRKTLNAKLSLRYNGPKLMDAFIISCNCVNIKPFEYFVLYLAGYSPNYCALKTEIYIRYNTREMRSIKVECEMIIYYPFLSNYFLKFGTVLLNCEEHRTIRICNETNDAIQVKWCRKEHISLSKKDSETTIATVEPDIKKLNEYLTIKPKKSYIAGKSSVFCTFTFAPKQSNAEAESAETSEPPFPLLCSAFLATTTDRDVRIEVKLCGSLIGPEITIINTSIDLGTINLGELQMFQIFVINNDIISGIILFNRLESNIDAKCTIQPEELELQPGESNFFNVSYYTKDVGKFVDVIVFKVKFGLIAKVAVSGESRSFQILMEPSEIDFGAIPICIVDRSSVILTNPLTVPIMIYTNVCNDGTDTPLILDIDDELPPINISRDWDFNMSKSSSEFSFWIYDSKCRAACDSFNFKEIESHHFNICTDWNLSEYSSGHSQLTEMEDKKMFQENVLDHIPNHAKKLIDYIKCMKIEQNPEAEIEIVQSILNYFVSMPYFEILKQKNYYKMANWDCIVTYPKEIIIEKYNFYLKPSESVVFRFLIVPNVAGKSIKEIHFKAIPINFKTTINELSEEDVDNNNFTTKLKVRFDCKVPLITFVPETIELNAFVEQQVEFLLKMLNDSNISGFANYKLLPATKDGTIIVRKDDLKFFIQPNELIEHKCYAKFLKIGPVTLQGLINIVGRVLPVKFNVFSNVKPPQIAYCPRKLNWQHETLINYKEKFFIENICPTKARFSIELKDETYVYCYPLGGILRPNQCVAIIFFSKHYDPGCYRNTLTIDVVNGCTYMIQIEVKVTGLPIEIQPNIKDDFNLGQKLVSKTVPYETNINFKNYGEHVYKLIFIRNKKEDTSIRKIVEFSFNKKELTLGPNQELTNILSIIGEKEGKMCSEFSVEVKLFNNVIKHFFRFTACGTFFNPKIKWIPNKICMRIEDYDCSSGKATETCILKNLTPLLIEVELRIEGNFILFDNQYFKYGKYLKLILKNHQERQLIIIFDEKHCRGTHLSAFYNGKVCCAVHEINQRSLSLTALMLFPFIKIEIQKINIFTDNLPIYNFQRLFNLGHIIATYNIKAINQKKYDEDILITEKMLDTKSVSEMVDSEYNHNFLINPDYFKEISCDYGTESEHSDDEDFFSNIEAEEDLLTDSDTFEKDLKKVVETISPSHEIKKNMKKMNLEKKDKKSETDDKKDKEDKNANKIDARKKDKNQDKNTIEIKPNKQEKIKNVKSDSENDIETKAEVKVEIPLPSVSFEDVFKSMATFLKKKDYIPKQTKIKQKKLIRFEKPSANPIEIVSVHLNPYNSIINEISSIFLNIFIEEQSPLNSVNTIKSDYEIKIGGGNVEELSIFVYNFRGRVELTPASFDFGTKPWYRVYGKNIKIFNANNIEFKVHILSDPYINESFKFINGYFTICSDEKLILAGKNCETIEFLTSLGFSYYFKQHIGIQVNYTSTTGVEIKGSGQLPMLWILDLPRNSDDTQSRQIEYSTLNYIYNYEIDNQYIPEQKYDINEVEKFQEYLSGFQKSNESIKSVRTQQLLLRKSKLMSKKVEEILYSSSSSETDENDKSIIPFIGDELPLKILFNSTTEFNKTSFINNSITHYQPIMENSTINLKTRKINKPIRYTYEKNARIIRKPKRTVRKYKAKLIQDYDDTLDDFVVLDYPKQYPSLFQIELMCDTFNFIFYLSAFKEMEKAFRKLCEKFYLTECKDKPLKKLKKPIANKLFIVRPIPYQVNSYLFEFGEISMNHEYTFNIDLLLSISEELILSARTLIAIPGFSAQFEYDESEPKVLIYQTNPPCSSFKSYKNLSERKLMSNPNCESCPKHKISGTYASCNMRVCHAHSYDIDLHMVHERQLDVRARSAINNYYTRLNQKFKEHKNPFILTELYQNDNSNITKKLLVKLKINFIACENYYSIGQYFEDYLYIDIHLGPSIPIYIKGLIVSKPSS